MSHPYDAGYMTGRKSKITPEAAYMLMGITDADWLFWSRLRPEIERLTQVVVPLAAKDWVMWTEGFIDGLDSRDEEPAA